MSLHYDEKGKFFTDYVSKDAVLAVIQTTTNRISGKLYVREGERLSDMLNREDHFLAVTDATIYDQDGQVISSSGFLAVNIDLIVWLRPEGNQSSNDDAGGLA